MNYKKIGCLCTCLLLVGCTPQKIIKSVEYGEDVDLKKIIEKKVSKDYTVTFNDDALWKYVNSNDAKDLKVGEYTCTVKAGKDKYHFIIQVEDFKKPIFKQFTKKITVHKGEKNINWFDFYQGEDKSEFVLEVDDSKVNYDKTGKYKINVSLIDEYKNTRTKDAIVEVVKGNTENKSEEVEGATYVDGILIVNKLHSIPDDFASGEDPEAGEHIRQLIQDMQNLGFNISSNYSGYRSHATQIGLYNGYVSSSGKEEADRYSARPGFSEHETGLCFDLIDGDGNLVESKAEADWIAENAHKYGFIVRYPFGKEEITGYIPEPWHLRYVGDKAKDIYESGLSLEEYLNVPGGKEYKDE